MATTTSGLVEQYLSEARRIEEVRRQKKRFRNVEAFPFWPHEAVRSTIIVLAFTASVLYMSALMPYFLEHPANPAGQPEVILPDWYLLWSYGLLKPGLANSVTLDGTAIDLPLMGPTPGASAPFNAKTMGILLNIIITVPLIAAPFISTGKARRPQEAPWTAAFGVAGIVYVFNASVYSVNNVIYTKIPWWGDGLHKFPTGWFHPLVAWLHDSYGMMAGLAAPLAGPGLWTFLNIALWVLPLPLAAFLVRAFWLKEGVRFAAFVAAVQVFLLVTIIAYGNGLDLLLMARGFPEFWHRALTNTNMLAWISWWTTLLAFEVGYWALKGWKLHNLAHETYEHDLNLTYYKVR